MKKMDAIEALALEIHQTRNANAARNGFQQQPFAGRERQFCLSEATHRISEAANAKKLADYEIAYWSRTSNAALKAMISQLETERATLEYGLSRHTALQDQDYAELTRMRGEYARRLTAKAVEDEAATDAALAESAERLADIRSMSAPYQIAAE
jgi:hypothetical protein